MELYANMCGAELWNRERTVAYMNAGIKPPGTSIRCPGCSGVPDLIACIEDRPPEDGYRLPELDPAPWYDMTCPESWNFAGLVVLEAELSPALDRRLVQGVGHGAVLTRPRFQGRTIDVKGVLIGKTCCSVEYGLRWLTQALLGGCVGCEGCLLTFLTCCPAQVDDEEGCLVLYEGDRPVPYFRNYDDFGPEWDRGPDFARQMYGAGLLSGPDVTARHGTSCGCSCAALTEVEFTIGIGLPWMYKLETVIADSEPIGSCEDDDCGLTFVKGGDCTGGLCPEPAPCDDDPNCGDATVSPPKGQLPIKDCGCFPLSSKRTCFAIPAYCDWFEQTLTVELYAGSSPLRNVAIRAFQNAIGYECCSDTTSNFSDCDACGTLFIDYVPAFGTLVFDSAARRVTVTCKNKTYSAAKNLSTVEGMPFRWIELSCQPACLMVDVDCANVADDATATVKTAGREL
jgi:hypothetical protein